MKNAVFVFLSLLGCSLQAQDNGLENPTAAAFENRGYEECCVDARSRPLIEAKFGYFFFASHKLRQVFDQGGVDAQISTSYPVWRWLQVYGSVEYLTRWGKSLGGNQKTSMWEIPLSLGLKALFVIHRKVDYYFAIGPRYCWVHAHNKSAFVDKNVSQNGIGGFINTGFNFYIREYIFVDVFGEYSYVKLHFHPSNENVFGRNIQVGGFVFGGGLGYAF